MAQPFCKQWYKSQCEEIRIHPERARGQNFLIDTNVADRMAQEVSDDVIEIGPGFGVLTHALVEKGIAVTTYDIEEKFRDTPIIAQLIEDQKIQWHTEDILKVNEQEFEKDYTLISNLPYSISSDVIIKFLTSKNPPKTIILMLQNEVVDRLIAQPPNMTQLSVTTQLLSTPKKLFKVSREQFWPIPNVDSAVVRLDRKERGEYIDEALKLARAGFSFKRKKLANNLKALVDDPQALLKEAGINPDIRAEALTIEEWNRLAKICG